MYLESMMDTEDSQRAEEVRKRGNELYKSCQFSQAIETYKEAAELAPLDPYPLSNLSIANFESGKYAQCIAKACLHLSLLGEADKLLRQLSPRQETEDLRNSLLAMEEFNMPSIQRNLLRELTLQSQDEPEYFGPGGDEAHSLYTSNLEESTDRDPVLSVMLCGVGDARHLFQTLIQYSARNKGAQKLHITMLDHKAAAIARDLIFFSLIHEANTDQGSKDTVLLSLSYLYSSPIIPPFAWEKLQDTIGKLLDKLESRQQPIEWIYLTMPQTGVVRALKHWQTGLATYATPQMRRATLQRENNQDFYDYAVVFPPEVVLSKFEPELSSLLASRRDSDRRTQKQIGKYLDKHWKVNATLIDMDWQARQAPGSQSYMENEPFSIIDNLTMQSSKLKVSDPSSRCLLQHAADFFERVGLSILQLRERLTMEVILGDMADVLERIRYGFLNRAVPSTTTEWPEKYHIIHMSNTPDYVGGSLTSFLYATPLLKQGTGTGLMSIENFNAEYLLMHDPATIRKHFSVELAEVELEEGPAPYLELKRYHRWERQRNYIIPLEQLMPKAGLFKWLHAHFLKICLPYYRNDDRVYAPLNMTTFMRLLVCMAELGYPGHWLSDIVKSLGNGEINTTARVPRKYALNTYVVDEVHTLRTMCVRPWRAEFTTLATQWRGLFPFAAVVPSGILPFLEIVTEYSIKIPFVGADYLDQPHFMLVFWNQKKYGAPVGNVYRLLLDDENGDKTTSAQKIRSDGINILSTFKWVSDEETATFWLKSDVVNLMLKEDWTYTPGQPLRQHLSRKRTWKECVTSA
ncbi:hypothetical protein F4805DRAFT_478149 [Annulohypoxylon moriforme]|nr:hypothetical protein F4805DRAFT_478149 [Annulohypoxylon moriforme]